MLNFISIKQKPTHQLYFNANEYKGIKEAEADLAVFKSQAEGIKKLQIAFNKENRSTLNYIMMEQGLQVSLAKIHATAITDLKPKITVWNTGEGNNGVNELIKSLPPLLTTIKDQTGISPPNWMAKMPAGK